MHLKIFVLPFLIFLVLVMGIGFIKPDILSMEAKKLEIIAKQAQSDNIETLLANIGTLTSSIDSHKSSESFLQKYLPKAMDQETVIDAINFTAIQSGVLVESIEVTQPASETAVVQTDSVGNVVSQELNADGTAVVNTKPSPKFFSVDTVVRGNYDNIKNFTQRLAHVDRFYSLKSFSVGLSKQDLASENPDISNLEGTFVSDFEYVKPLKYHSALTIGIFNSSVLDFSAIDKVIAWVTNSVPVLEKPPTGKPNPFQ